MGEFANKNELMNEVREELAKTLGPTEVLALALGAIVGWGCFMLPGITFLPNAGPIGTVIAFFVGALFQCVVALTYSFLIKPYPVAGGAFAYAYAGFGSKGAFICGWALVLSYICVIAANATAIILLVRFLFGSSIQFGYLYTVLDWDIYLSEVGYITVILIGFGYMNFRGVDAASTIQVFLAFALTIGVLVLAGGTAAADTASIENLKPFFAENRSPIACVMMVLALTPWLFVGFDTIPQTAEEFAFSPSKARDLMLLSIICGAIIYALVTLSVAGLIPYKELLAANHSWATGWVADQVFGRWGGVALAVPVLAGILTGMNGFFMATTRLLFSMGRSKFLPNFFSEVHPKYNTAWKSVVFITVLTLIVPWFGRPALDWIVSMSSIGTALAYLFTCLTARKYLEAHPELRESTWGKPVCIMGAMTSVICIGLLMVPSSPVAINVPNWCMLFAWVTLGAIFFIGKQQELLAIPHSTMRYLLFGKAEQEVLFDTMEDDEDIM
ncbi:APC family permease [uncultured Desulfovibrio sp.]|uniref:APC family permease n=1 Tax=uncultured Desulfovibrio sp. TaxID=167968 RepID=UPI00260FCD69|nr:APC family permease [uncultured Desulfovibrio sp.]